MEDNQLITYSFLNRGKVVFSHSLCNKLYDSRPGHSTKHKYFQSLFEWNDNKIMVMERVFFYFNSVERLVAECPKSLNSFPTRPLLLVYIYIYILFISTISMIWSKCRFLSFSIPVHIVTNYFAVRSGLAVNLFLKSLYLLDMFSQQMSPLWWEIFSMMYSFLRVAALSPHFIES